MMRAFSIVSMLTLTVSSSVANTAAADNASVTLSDGTEFSFELVRSGSRSISRLSSGVASGEGEGYRVLFDGKQGGFYGYTVKGTPLGKGRFRLELGPLKPEVLERLTKRFASLSETALVGEALTIEYPPPQEVQENEALLLELMVNPSTGEKLADVIRVRAKTEASAPDGLSVVRAVVKIDGKPVDGTGSVSGQFLFFWVQGHGRFVVSGEPVNGYAFVPASLSEDRKTLRFDSAGSTYEWAADQPFKIGTEPVSALWVLA
jgi:hypothetical protein